MSERRHQVYLALGVILASTTPGWLLTAYQVATPAERLDFWALDRWPAFIPAFVGLIFLIGVFTNTLPGLRPKEIVGPDAAMDRLIREGATEAKRGRRAARERAFRLANRMLWCDPTSPKQYPGFGPNSPLDKDDFPDHTMLQKLRAADDWRWWHVRARWRRRTRQYTPAMHREFERVVEALADVGLKDTGLTHKAKKDTLTPRECSEAAATLNYLANKIPANG